MKKFFKIILICILTITSSISPVFASNIEDNTPETAIIGTFELDIPIQTSNSESMFIDENEVTPLAAVESGVVSAAISRSGNSNVCELYLVWRGSFVISGMKFNKLTVVPTNYLSSTYYEYMFNVDYYKYFFPNTTLMYQKISVMSIPTSVTKVRVNVSNLSVYTSDSGWLSGILKSGAVTIK